jgi:alpha-glucosidase (family GH31 glycosyl hydrolase)
MPRALTVDHAPHGIDHPYEPYFHERRPRDPSGGDMVVLGFLSRPGRAAEDVRVEWTRNGRSQTTIHGRAFASGTDEDRWLVELGVMEAGDAVTYRIFGRDEAGTEVATPEFAFVVRQWFSATNAIRLPDGRFRLLGRQSKSGPVVEVERGADGLHVVITGASSFHQPDRPPCHSERSEESRYPQLSCFAKRDPSTSLRSAQDDGRVDLGEVLALPRTGGACLPLGLRWQEEAGRLTAVELTGGLTPEEALVGFGERFDALDQRGRAFDSSVFEQYKNQGNRTYLPTPFFVSSAGYGLLVEGTARVDYDLGRSVPDRWRCVVRASGEGTIAFQSFAGASDAVVRAMTAVTGRPEPLPLWAYGLWMSSNEWNSQARTEREVAETVHHGIPATVLVIEAWSDETTFYVWNGAEYAPQTGANAFTLSDFTFPADGPWPDPAAMCARLREQGIHLVLWQIPVLKDAGAPYPQHDADIAYALEQGFVLRNDDRTPYRNPFFWFNNALIPDFTSADATQWWMEKRRYLLEELGVDGFKTDGGEHLVGRGLRASDGRRGGELVNTYPILYVRAYHDYAKAVRSGEALTFSRAGYTGAGAYPAHWAGDENSTWEAYRRSLVAGLTAGLSGVIFWGWDLAGFSDALPSAELYLRSAAAAAFCPIMQYHSEYNPSGPSRDRTPWNIAANTGDNRAIDLFRYFARVRMNLLPYVAREATHAAANGTPLMRALLLDHPDDPVAWTVQDQYKFGRQLLVAPVVEEVATERTLYLPAGVWIDLWSGEQFMGNQWITVEAPWERIPVFAHGGSIIPLRLGEAGRLGDDTGNGVSVTDGLTYWLALDPNAERGGDDDLGVGWTRERDGRLSISVPVVEHSVRVTAPSYRIASAPPGTRNLVLDRA